MSKNILVLYEERSFYGDSRDTVSAMEDLLGNYQSNVEETKISDLKNYDFNEFDYVFVIALDREINDEKFYEGLLNFSGKIIWFGNSIDTLIELGNYPLEYKGEVYDLLSVRYRKSTTGDEKKFSIGTKRAFYRIDSLSSENDIYSWLSDGTEEFPFIISSENLIYVSRVDINEPLFYIFSDFLNQLFYKKNNVQNQFLISIEDVHVFSDYDNLRNLADRLYSSNVPFTIGLIPYIQQEGADYITYFTEVSEFVEVLKYMQDKGGSIILHTYVHEMSEDGLEISTLEKNPLSDLDNYFDQAIGDCIDNGLIPIGYESPHSFLSEADYKKLKGIFSNAYGQIAITDGNYIIFPFEIYDTKNFNVFYPFNLGYITPLEKDSFRLIEERFDRIKLVDGYFAGVYFHNYLEPEYIDQLINILLRENVRIFNPLEESVSVKSEKYSIEILDNKIVIDDSSLVLEESKVSIFFNALSGWFRYLLLFALSIFILILFRSFTRQRKNMFK
ncbi:MAG: DUF2334 domain-containing protein [Acidaminobacteraceae bacterium]